MATYNPMAQFGMAEPNQVDTNKYNYTAPTMQTSPYGIGDNPMARFGELSPMGQPDVGGMSYVDQVRAGVPRQDLTRGYTPQASSNISLGGVMGGLGQAINLGSGLYSAWLGKQQLDLGKKSLAQNTALTNRNLSNQAKAYNLELANQTRAKQTSSDPFSNQMSIDEALARFGADGSSI